MADVPTLRKLLRPAVGDMKDGCTNSSIPEFCQKLGLPVPADEGDKRSRLHAAFDALPDSSLPALTDELLRRKIFYGDLRNRVQDALWSDLPIVDIPKRARREVSRALGQIQLFKSWERFEQLLQEIFLFEPDFRAILTGERGGTLAWVHRHFVRNPEDADVELLFDTLKAFDLPPRRFAIFLEKLASAEIQVDAEAQEELVAIVNPHLRSVGVEFRHTSNVDGYPVFKLESLRTPKGRPKNLIFASAIKPDIRFRDAINNDIEIVAGKDDVLVYDRPLTPDGLQWGELQQWWAELTNEPDANNAKQTLFYRLQDCLPESSPPQRALFRAFFKTFGDAVPRLPALLPEVWLHWDPKTVAARGANALLHHRMDFLMLLPGGARVVLEVDGVHHYSDDDGRPSPRVYGRMAAGDRELKLAGYEVFRFGGAELQGDKAQQLASNFFRQLFHRHGIDF